MRYIALFSLIMFIASNAYGERYEYRSDVDRIIPDYDSTGVTDTIFVPVHVAIEDINFYIGIGTENHMPWAEQVMIDVYSPQNIRVRINDWQGEGPPVNWYWVWYDTERIVDGPGHLDDYIGYDAYGPWVMHVFDNFEDREVYWYYWIAEIYGEPTTGIENEDLSGVPNDFELSGNYPNPFNSATAVKFGLPEEAEVNIAVYDVLGRLVRVLTDETLPAGYHRVVWDGRDQEKQAVSSGVYMLRMKSGDRSFDKRMTMVK